MDNQCLVVLSKLSVAARPVIGAVNPAKLIKDLDYSADVFDRIFAQGDEALILLALEVQGLLSRQVDGQLKTANNVTLLKPELEVNENVAPVQSQKYMFGARS